MSKNLQVAFLICCVFTWPALTKTDGPDQSNIEKIIVHAIGGPTCKDDKVVFSPAGGNASTWKKYIEDHEEISIHYVIDRAGTTLVSLPENKQANHAFGHNKNSIGIELVNKGDGKEKYPKEQVDALKNLLKELTGKYGIHKSNVYRHSDIDSRTFSCGGKEIKRKQDPGDAFPWEEIWK